VPRVRAPALVVLVLLLIGVPLAQSAAQDPGIANNIGDSVTDPQSTVQGVTPTPSGTATPLPLETATPEASATASAEPTPVGRDFYITPGYGSATEQSNKDKRAERARACSIKNRPPTSHMLGVPGIVLGNPSGSWLPILAAVAFGALVFAGLAYVMRKRGAGSARQGPLEGIAALVGICGGLAALAAQFVPSAAVKERPPKAATMEVRDIKPRITRGEYLSKIPLSDRQRTRVHRRYTPIDLDEVGNVVWLEISLKGFKDQPLRLDYGSYDLDARGALLPDSSKSVQLGSAERDVQTLFFPAWVGYPRSQRFKAEFRLIDRRGVQQLTATDPMTTSSFRYACEAKN
jgi:hypothetical protein